MRQLAQGLTFTRWLTSNVEKSLIERVGARKLTVSRMDEQLSMILKALMKNTVTRDRGPELEFWKI
jgi:hypothetical protein